MIQFSVGGRIDFPGPVKDGMAVIVSEYGLVFALFVESDAPVVDHLVRGKIQIGFLNANPFGWWFINARQGFVDACWAMARLPKDLLPAIQGVLEHVLSSLDPSSTEVQPAPAAALIIANAHDQRILGIRPLGLRADSWIRMAQALLDHPTEMPEEKLAYWQQKYEARWYNKQDFGSAKELLWVDTFE